MEDSSIRGEFYCSALYGGRIGNPDKNCEDLLPISH